MNMQDTNENMLNNNVNEDMNHSNKDELKKLLTSDNFWDEFVKRTQITNLVANNEKIRPTSSIQIIARLRGLPSKSINNSDRGVQFISGKTLPQLKTSLEDAPITILAYLLDIPENEVPEVYKGIVIEGLPSEIINDDGKLRQLDNAVLIRFSISHIEVDRNLLRITFTKDATQEQIDELRKALKVFLKEEMKLDKKLMKGVSLIPHTRETWKGDVVTTTQSEVDSPTQHHTVDSNQPYEMV